MLKKAIFLDRDGTINFDPGYLDDPAKVKLLPQVGESLAKLKNDYGFMLIVISNQSGIARGLITSEQVQSINRKINDLLSSYKVEIDSFYFCPHHPDYSEEGSCSCRKPSPQMVFQAADDFKIDLSKSYFIGDKESDIECGNNAGVKTVLITDSINNKENIKLKNSTKIPRFVAYNFGDVCTFIIQDFSSED